MSAYKKQIGGSHYKDMVIQPSTFINENRLLFAEGNAIKYLFDTYQNGDTLKMTNQIENNLGRNGSFMKQMVENISSSSFLK